MKTVVFTFGRFQPPTKGHQLVFDTVKAHAKTIGAEHRIYASRSDPSILGRPSSLSAAQKITRAEQNPLDYSEKHQMLTQLFPDHNIVDNPEVKTIFDAVHHMSTEGGDEHLVFVGEEARRKVVEGMQKYIGHKDFPNLKKASFVLSGDRDPDAEGVEGISGTKVRLAATQGDHDSFHSMMPSGVDRTVSQQIMRKLRHSINRTKIAIDQFKNQKKSMVESFDRFLLVIEEEKDRTRKRRDHRMYGWGDSTPTKKQRSNRQKKDNRTVARRKANASGRTHKGDTSVDLDHKNGNANDNSPDNLRVISRHFNRSRNNNK